MGKTDQDYYRKINQDFRSKEDKILKTVEFDYGGVRVVQAVVERYYEDGNAITFKFLSFDGQRDTCQFEGHPPHRIPKELFVMGEKLVLDYIEEHGETLPAYFALKV